MIESLKFADGIMHSSKWFVVAFILLWLPAQIIAQDMTPEQVERMRQAEARQRAEEYARSRDLTAQDMIVAPQQYLIGPGDELTIFFSGAYTREYQINVTPEGSVLVPEFGAIQLGQITLGEAKEKVLAALAQRYYNLEISITLSKLRKLKVSVDGEVYFPGIYTITSLDRATEAIQMAGGLRDNASRRNISLIRNDSVHNVDLLLFARGGNQSRNPCLAEGDKIFVPPRQPLVGLVEIYGPVKMPGKYEYVEDDRIYDLVMLAGGLQIEADSNLAELVRFDPSGDSTFTMNIALK